MLSSPRRRRPTKTLCFWCFSLIGNLNTTIWSRFCKKKSSPSGKSSQVERMMKSYYLGQGEYTDDKEQGQDFILILSVLFNICLISSNPSHSVQSQVWWICSPTQNLRALFTRCQRWESQQRWWSSSWFQRWSSETCFRRSSATCTREREHILMCSRRGATMSASRRLFVAQAEI